MNDQTSEKNLPASPYKLEKARERGEVSKSLDVISASMMTTAFLALSIGGSSSLLKAFSLAKHHWQSMLQHIHLSDGGGSANVVQSLLRFTEAALMLGLGFFLSLMAVAVLSNLLQTGPIFSLEPIKIQWSRIHPVQGFKRLFSMRTLVDGLRATLKLAACLVLAGWALWQWLPSLHQLQSLNALGFLHAFTEHLGHYGLQLAALLVVFAAIDIWYSRREYAKKMRMSHHEVQDEYKHREGDPRIKSKIKQLRQEAAEKTAALAKTRDASVIITNPTHYAVALRYVHGEMNAPVLLCKGKGVIAAFMRKIAFKHRIPVVHNPPLAREIYRLCQHQSSIPEQLYPQVAQIMIWLMVRHQGRRP